MTDPATIYGLVNSVKTIADMVKGINSLHTMTEVKSATSGLLDTLLSVQQDLMVMQVKHSALIDSERDLKQKILQIENWEAEKQRYQLENRGDTAFLYVIKPDMQGSEPRHGICATCYQNRVKSILQLGRGVRGIEMMCPVCKTSINATRI